MNEHPLDAIHSLFQRHGIDDNLVNFRQLSGTTAGRVLRLDTEHGESYILKFETPEEIRTVERLVRAYDRSPLLPQVLFTAEDYSYFAYEFIEGTTHFNRGAKKDWMALLTRELLNRYEESEQNMPWGRIGYEPSRTWKDFNDVGIREARINLGGMLTEEDYEYVCSIADRLFADDSAQGRKYLLHGDTGVHNFVYRDSTLIGVIDPSPMIGPILYDFLYAFCSSPDDLNIETLLDAYDTLKHEAAGRSRLIREVLIQLYCRIGLSVKHHPHDLPGYLEAWGYWKKLGETSEEN
ncbi:hypothetical protein B9G55_14600 [Saccharibacillus sp. O16]|nr:hypothetical protein B9G55_14600 [Saccharibacillus sp. O16]